MKKVENELLGLEKDIKSVNAKVFVCQSDAEKEWERFYKEHRNSLYLYDVAYVKPGWKKKTRQSGKESEAADNRNKMESGHPDNR